MSAVKPFPKELLQQILTGVDAFQKRNSGPLYAAFDADGTLWDNDIGENFFQYQIDHCDLPELKGLDPWPHYLALKKKNPPEAYLWLAQLCNGRPLSEVQEWARNAVGKNPPQVFDPQKNLIAEFLKRKITVYVVSASVQWSIEAALPFVGLPPENAIGVKTIIRDGKVSFDGDGPVTWREGKRSALMTRTKNQPVVFAAGNTSGDLHLLESAHISLAVQTQLPGSDHSKLYEDEQNLLVAADKNRWLSHSFR